MHWAKTSESVLFTVQIRIMDAWLPLEWARDIPQPAAHAILAHEQAKGGRMRMIPVYPRG